MNFSQRLPVFITDTHPCSYLEGKQARTAFVDPNIEISQSLASALNLRGFRRSGRYLYKASCPDCSACQPLRVLVDQFVPSRSQKRNLKKNADLETRILKIDDMNEEKYQAYFTLYEAYISSRHDQGDMYPPSREQFDSFIGQLYSFSRLLEFRLDNKLIMVSLCDELEDGLSAIYTFFDPELQDRGLGVYSTLWQIQYCLESKLAFVYMGFWVKDCNKMNYKSKYRPNQIFHSDSWQPGPN